MANPVKFPESNFVWRGHPETEDQNEITDLHTFTGDDLSFHISKWEFTEEEIEEIQKNKCMWLYVYGMHPPVSVMGHKPGFVD